MPRFSFRCGIEDRFDFAPFEVIFEKFVDRNFFWAEQPADEQPDQETYADNVGDTETDTETAILILL